MQKLALPIFVLAVSFLASAASRAQTEEPERAPAEAVQPAGPCEACKTDEQQIGSYVEPDVAIPAPKAKPDPRGIPVKVPTPSGPATVHVNPREGVWLGSPGDGMGNVYLQGKKDKASVGWRLGF